MRQSSYLPAIERHLLAQYPRLRIAIIIFRLTIDSSARVLSDQISFVFEILGVNIPRLDPSLNILTNLLGTPRF